MSPAAGLVRNLALTAVPLVISGMLMTSTALFALSPPPRHARLRQAVLFVNVTALAYALLDAGLLALGGLLGEQALARQFHLVKNIVAWVFNPLAFVYCEALLGEPSTRVENPASGLPGLRKTLRVLAAASWTAMALACLATAIDPVLLVDARTPAPNPANDFLVLGRGQSGTLADIRTLLNMACLLAMPPLALAASRAGGWTRESPFFIIATIFPSWFGVQEVAIRFFGRSFGLLAGVDYSRAILGLGLFALLAAVAANLRYSREAAEREAALELAARERKERGRAESQMRSAESRLEQVFDFLPDPTFAIDAAGRVIVWNKAAERLSGVPAADIIGKGGLAHSLAFYGEARPILIDLALAPDPTVESGYDRLERSGDVVIAENRNGNVNGGRGAWLWAIAAPFKDEEGRIVGAVECIRDITRIKENESRLEELAATLETRVEERGRELEHARDSLVESEKAAVVGRLGATIAHELNTPLAAILSTSATWNAGINLALASYADAALSSDREARRRLDTIVTSSARGVEAATDPGRFALRRELASLLEAAGAPDPRQAADLLADLLPPQEALAAVSWAAAPDGLALLEAGENIASILRGAAIVSEAARKATRVVSAISSFSRHETDTPVPVDVVESLETILVLYYGSLKHCVTVEKSWLSRDKVLAVRDSLDQVWVNLINNAVQAMAHKGLLSLSTRREEASLVVAVGDSGPGIPPEIAPRIFEPFFTTKAQGEGSGLGLDAARRIVGRFGGSISFDSRPGHTVFEVRLPLAPAGRA